MSPNNLQALEDESKQIKTDWLTEVISEPSSVIYHYTDAEGLLGILESGCLWASHFLGMNDVSEVNYGRQLALDVVKTISASAAENSRECLAVVSGLIEEFDLIAPPYMVCFCADDNLLSQWREYSNRGDGFSIGFETLTLTNGLGSVALLKVCYDRATQERVMRTTTERYCALLEKYAPIDATQARGLVGAQLSAQLTLQILAFKNPDFHEEKEWRVVYLDQLREGALSTKYRAGQFGIVPYKELAMTDGKKLPIRSIRQGPTVDRKLAKAGVELLLRDLGYTGIDIGVSEIPLR